MSATHILVVDDEPDIRGLVQGILEDEGYRVSGAESGTAARLALRERRPDLILLDIWMPDLDGISLLKEWAQDEGLPCPVIMMSGPRPVETAVEATGSGASTFWKSRLSMAKLLLTVGRARGELEKLQQENLGLKRRAPLVRAGVDRRCRPSSGCAEQGASVPRPARYLGPDYRRGRQRPGDLCPLSAFTESPTRTRPFVDLASPALARQRRAGMCLAVEKGGITHYGGLEKAAGGTLLMDEVVDMDLEAQLLLLGALDSGSFLRRRWGQPGSDRCADYRRHPAQSGGQVRAGRSGRTCSVT